MHPDRRVKDTDSTRSDTTQMYGPMDTNIL
jgi:hypothetical protein